MIIKLTKNWQIQSGVWTNKADWDFTIRISLFFATKWFGLELDFIHWHFNFDLLKLEVYEDVMSSFSEDTQNRI